jgi:hypothetical protein
MRIVPERTRAITVHEECALLRSAISSAPGSMPMRRRLTDLLIEGDAFDEAIALLSGYAADDLGLEGLLQLATALLARDATTDRPLAWLTLDTAFAVAKDDRDRAHVLLLRAKLLLREGNDGDAQKLLTRAHSLDPHSASILARLANLLLRQGRADDVIAICDILIADGVGQAQLLAVRTQALAALGQIDDARALSNIGDHGFSELIRPPAGWDDLDSFNAALVGELMANPAIRFGRHGTASVQSWRIDRPAIEGAPAMAALLNAIADMAIGHIMSLGKQDHPWLAMRPDDAVLQSWCVITDGNGHEQWHMHPAGWMSGGYYPQVPNAGTGHLDGAGCLAFGLPANAIGGEAASGFGERLVAPQSGMLTLFPSHCYHRTYPHKADGERRICIAFDIIPG